MFGSSRYLNRARSTPEKKRREGCKGKLGIISPISNSTDLYQKDRNLVNVLDVGNQKLEANKDNFKLHDALL